MWNSYRIESRYGRPRQWFGFAMIVRETPGTEAPGANSPLAFAVPVTVANAIGRATHFPRKSPPPLENVNATVVGSTTATVNPVSRPAFRYRWYEADTAAAPRAVPSANFALGRMWNVTLRAERFTVQSSASHGAGTSVALEGIARESYRREWRTAFPGPRFNGSGSRTAIVATTRVPPYRPPGPCARAGAGARLRRRTAAAIAAYSGKRTPFTPPSPPVRPSGAREAPSRLKLFWCGARDRRTRISPEDGHRSTWRRDGQNPRVHPPGSLAGSAISGRTSSVLNPRMIRFISGGVLSVVTRVMRTSAE